MPPDHPTLDRQFREVHYPPSQNDGLSLSKSVTENVPREVVSLDDPDHAWVSVEFGSSVDATAQ